MDNLAEYLEYARSSIALRVVIGITTLVYFYYKDVMRAIYGKNTKFVVDGRTIVLTGGSQGMGKSLAIQLSRKGANVVIVARNAKLLEETLAEVSAAAANPASQRFKFIAADVTIPEESTRIIQEVTAWNDGSPPDIVWANAGAATPRLFLDTSIETLHAQMNINYFAAAYLARATLQAWTKPGKVVVTSPSKTRPPSRHFVSTSSVAAFCGIAGYAPYSPAKAALRSLHDTLTSEMNIYNAAANPKVTPKIELHIVFPGTIVTAGLDKENETKHPVTKVLEEGDVLQGPDVVARVTLKELAKGRHMITTQMLAAAMRAGAMQGSRRDRKFVDTVFGWVIQVAWLWIQPDMDDQVWKWGKKNGIPEHVY